MGEYGGQRRVGSVASTAARIPWAGKRRRLRDSLLALGSGSRRSATWWGRPVPRLASTKFGMPRVGQWPVQMALPPERLRVRQQPRQRGQTGGQRRERGAVCAP